RSLLLFKTLSKL
ncbi:hypothetical protein VCHENC02_3488, partial [Vibrio harveyi]